MVKGIQMDVLVLTNEVFTCTMHPHPNETNINKVYHFKLHNVPMAKQAYLDLLCNSLREIMSGKPCIIILDCSAMENVALVTAFFKLGLGEFCGLQKGELKKFIMITSKWALLLRATANAIIQFKKAGDYASIVSSQQEAYGLL